MIKAQKVKLHAVKEYNRVIMVKQLSYNTQPILPEF
jgi:hypothetical protein